jgi:hypothetical protein
MKEETRQSGSPKRKEIKSHKENARKSGSRSWQRKDEKIRQSGS